MMDQRISLPIIFVDFCLTNAWGFCRTNQEHWRRQIGIEVDLYQPAVLIVTVLVWIYFLLKILITVFYFLIVRCFNVSIIQILFLALDITFTLKQFKAFSWYIVVFETWNCFSHLWSFLYYKTNWCTHINFNV